MTVHHTIDNEPAWGGPLGAFGEWDNRTQAGTATIVRSADAAWPERGAAGIRATYPAGDANAAYLTKTLDQTLTEIWLQLQWRRVGSAAVAAIRFLELQTAGAASALLVYHHAGEIKVRIYTNAGQTDYTAFTPASDRWYRIAVRAKYNAAGGEVQAWVDGVEALATQAVAANQNKAPAVLQLGCMSRGVTQLTCDYDEIQIADAYPEPFAAPPADEYPSAARTLVLYRQGSADSREFADYCVSEMGVPRANLVRLDNATATETLADYATFQAEVETDLAAYLALHPTVAARASCFLLGYGVPGAFTHGGVVHSAASRLMNYGTAFSSATANPLYDPDPVARLTKAGLGGKYLATRIDADSLANAKALIDSAATVAALSALPDADTLFSDDAAYRASVACGKLRIVTAALAAYADDAFVWGDTGTPAFGAAGSRVAFVDDSASAAASLRTNAAACATAMIDQGYAAALGASETADGFDAESFLEMLRIGGTFAEAVAVAVEHIDYTAVPAGSPLMTVAFERGGYNIYGGVGSADAIDWGAPVACVRPGQQTISFGQALAPGERQAYAARAVSAGGVEEHNTHVVAYVEQANGDLAGPPLARPGDLTADVLPTGDLLMGLSYRRPVGFASPDGFDVLSDNGTGQIDLENPVATIDDTEEGRTDYEVLITAPETSVRLAVRARRRQDLGPISEVVFVPLSAPPAPPETL